jgi:predicted RNA-binding Zn ribbon-like protein
MVSELDFSFHAELGAPSLHFVATVGHRHREAPVERLTSPQRLAEWFVEAGLLSEPPVLTESDLASARVLREAIFRTIGARTRSQPFAERDVATINSFADDELPRTILRADGTAVRTATAPVRAALAAVARDAIDVLTQHVNDLRICQGDDCSALFIDTSRGKRRRWCTMSRCGNR